MTTRQVRRGRHACDLPAWGIRGELIECCVCGRRWRYKNPGNPDYAGWRITWGSFLGLHRFR